MTIFQRGLDPKAAMEIGEVAYCKKKYVDSLCSKCQHAAFDWCPSKLINDPLNKNYCKLNYWGLPDKKFMKFLKKNTVSVKIQ